MKFTNLPPLAYYQQMLARDEQEQPSVATNPCEATQKGQPVGETETQKLEKRLARGELLMIFFTALIAISTVAYSIIAQRQLSVMSQQLDEIRSSSKQTDKLIEAATKQAANMETLATAAINQIEELKSAAKATQASASANARVAKVSEDTLNLTQAADLEFLNFKCQPQPLGLKTGVRAIFRNSGRTRADNVEVIWHLGTKQGATAPARPEPSIAALGPGTRIETEALLVGTYITEEVLKAISDGKLVLSGWGSVTYDDIFGNKHRFEFDAAYVPKSDCEFFIRSQKTIKQQSKDERR